MIQVTNLTKYFGPIVAIRDVNFEVQRGEVVGFLGLNGAGKTTTMRILTGYLPASSGYASVAGYDVMTQSLEVRRNIGYLQESVPLYPEMRIEEYLHFRAKLKGVARTLRARRIEYCLERSRLREVRRRLIGTLSKGYRQRVGLADSMLHDPPILILDEPTSGMDPEQIRETLSLIKELGENRTVLLSTHILSEVETVCDRVIIIAKGRVGLSARLDEIDNEENSRLVVEVRGASDEVQNALGRVAGVRDAVTVGQEDGVVTVELALQPGEDPREKVSQTIVQRGWALRRLNRKRRRLEDAFFETLRNG